MVRCCVLREVVRQPRHCVTWTLCEQIEINSETEQIELSFELHTVYSVKGMVWMTLFHRCRSKFTRPRIFCWTIFISISFGYMTANFSVPHIDPHSRARQSHALPATHPPKWWQCSVDNPFSHPSGNCTTSSHHLFPVEHNARRVCVRALALLVPIHMMVSWSSLTYTPCDLLASNTEANFHHSNSFTINSMYSHRLQHEDLKTLRRCCLMFCQTNFHRVEVPFFPPLSINHLSILHVMRVWRFTSLCIQIQSNSKEMKRFLSRHSFYVNKSTEHKWKERIESLQMASSMSRARLCLSAKQWNSDPFRVGIWDILFWNRHRSSSTADCVDTIKTRYDCIIFFAIDVYVVNFSVFKSNTFPLALKKMQNCANLLFIHIERCTEYIFIHYFFIEKNKIFIFKPD